VNSLDPPRLKMLVTFGKSPLSGQKGRVHECVGAGLGFLDQLAPLRRQRLRGAIGEHRRRAMAIEVQ